MSWIAQDGPSAEQVSLREPTGSWSGRLTLREILAPTFAPVERIGIVQVHVHHVEDRGGPHLDETNWPAAIEMIRDVGARMRQMQRSAQDAAQQSQTLLEGSLQRIEETERRLRIAEAALREARQRAEHAESAAQMADARARRAEEEAQIARAGQAEAQMWLRRLYANMRMEFEDVG